MLSLDVLRVLGGSPQAATTFLRQCATRLASAATAGQQAAGSGSARAPLQQACTALQSSLPGVAERLEVAAAAPASPEAQVEARQLAFAMARLFVGGQLGNNREAWGEEPARWAGTQQLLLGPFALPPGCAASPQQRMPRGLRLWQPPPLHCTLPTACSSAGRAYGLERGGGARPAGTGMVPGAPRSRGNKQQQHRPTNGGAGTAAHSHGAVWGGPLPAAATGALLRVHCL